MMSDLDEVVRIIPESTLLNDHQYLASPISVLKQSGRTSRLQYSDLLDSHHILNTRLRSIEQAITQYSEPITPPALCIVQEHGAALLQCLLDDILRAEEKPQLTKSSSSTPSSSRVTMQDLRIHHLRMHMNLCHMSIMTMSTLWHIDGLVSLIPGGY
jgi:hypothetical protein